MNNRKAYVFDIDGTLLSEKHLPYWEGPHSRFIFSRAVSKADSPHIPVGKALYHEALLSGAEIHLLTAREPGLRGYTIKNLVSEGYHIFHGLYMKPYGIEPPDFKISIRASLSKKVQILATVGNADTDFVGGNIGLGLRIVDEAIVEQLS